MITTPLQHGGRPRAVPPALIYHLPGDTRSPAAARSLVRDALATFSADTSELAQLLVSELVTNAVLHARTPVVLQVRIDGDRVKVAVNDGSGTCPKPGATSAGATGGRGLQLVNSLAGSWGWQQTLGGKCIWFEL
jgi:anti-sigma regulatory factor (Ser/Thr protein kinase)